jgi:predicted PurR-regulated permease PerM
VLAAWFASLTRRLWERLSQRLGQRPRLAAVLTVVALVLLVIPLVAVGVSLGVGGVEFVRRIAASEENRSRLVQLVTDKPSTSELPRFEISSLVNLLQEHGSKAWQVVRAIAGKTATGLVGLFIFLFGAYTFLVDGQRFSSWLTARMPIAPQHLRRLSAAFYETGRGMLVSVGLTGLVQGVVATIAYFALKIPSALGLGILTAVAALIPSVGTAMVWIPVAIGLALSGRWIAAIVLGAIGVLVIGTVDNILRPVFSRYGQLNLPTFVLFLAIFGGIALYGAAGIILGPLLVRLGVEALNLAREQGLTAGPADEVGEVGAPAVGRPAEGPSAGRS